MTTRKRYTARYERDVDGRTWLVHIEGIEGCHTYGRTLRQAGDRITEALALWLDRAPDWLEVEHRLPDDVARVADEVTRARQLADAAVAAAQHATVAAARCLQGLGISRRDTGDLLGISHQRVQQLLAG
jgi:predicted RNase H-like HicB family nuclease